MDLEMGIGLGRLWLASEKATSMGHKSLRKAW